MCCGRTARRVAAPPLPSGRGAERVRPQGKDLEWARAVAAQLEERGLVPGSRNPAGISAPTALALLTTAAAPGSAAGAFLMVGPAERVAQLGPAAAAAMDGRGGGKGRFQGKVKNVRAAGDFVRTLLSA